MEVRHALLTVRWAHRHRQELIDRLAPAQVTIAKPGSVEAAEALGDVDVAILRGDPDEHVLRAPNLRWVHCDHAGIDRFAPPELFGQRFVVTTSAGRSAPVLAEHALHFMLSLSHQAPRLWRAQRRRVWGLPGLGDRRGLHGKTVLIVGCGHTGVALAARCKAFEMEVIGYRRRDLAASWFDEVHSRERGAALLDLLGRAEVLVLAASLNDTSRHIIRSSELAALPAGAQVINIGRGGLIDEAALRRALVTGHIGGAGLDVTSVEPLPPTSRLWRTPNLLITPHATPQVADRDAASLRIIAANLQRYRDGTPLTGALGPDDAYTGHRPTPALQRHLTQRWRRWASRGI